MRLAQEGLVSDHAGDGTLKVVKLDGHLIGMFALRQADGVGAKLQVRAQRSLILRPAGLVVDHGGNTV